MNIQIYNGVFTKEQHEYIVAQTVLGSTWQFSGYSNTPNSAKFWYMDLNNNEVFAKDFLQRIEELTKQQFELDKVYANGQTHGLSGEMHQDVAGGNGTWRTFLYYVGPEWKPGWGGATAFHDVKTGGIQLIYPTPNAGVLFDSEIWHQGQEPTRACYELRITVAWKLKLK
jgi:Rps23 Pro-64 3,4-dihydroxylase Tpa1-like proline 4-hydroxylase